MPGGVWGGHPYSHPLAAGSGPVRPGKQTLHMLKLRTDPDFPYSPTAASATAEGWGWVSSEAPGSSREHSGARGGGDQDARVGATTSQAGWCRGPESPQCPPVQCGWGAG